MLVRRALPLLLATCLRAQSPPPVPAVFEPNVGQAPADVRFLFRGDYDGLTIKAASVNWLRYNASVQFVGASNTATSRAVNAVPGRLNIFHGNDPSKWLRNIPLSAGAEIDDVYPGISVTYSFAQRTDIVQTLLKYTVSVQPGASPANIRLKVNGFGNSVESASDLKFVGGAAPGVFSVSAPSAYQLIGSQRVPVNVRFQVAGDQTVNLILSSYSQSDPLYLEWTVNMVPSPLIKNATPSSSLSAGTTTAAFGIPAANGNCIDSECTEIWAAFIDASHNLKWLTLLGGAGADSLTASQQEGPDAYLRGTTNSSDFPITPNAAQSSYSGQYDLVLARLNGDTGELKTSTYFGEDNGFGGPMAVDADGNVYITGDRAANVPNVANRITRPYALKWDSQANRFLYLTALPVSPRLIALTDAKELVFAAAGQAGLPTSANAVKSSYTSSRDIYLDVLSADGSGLLYATYLQARGLTGDTAMPLKLLSGRGGGLWLVSQTSLTSTLTVDRLDLSSGRLLNETELATYAQPIDIYADGAGGIWAFATASGRTVPLSASALQFGPCLGARLLAHFSATGALEYSTWLPADVSAASLVIDSQGRPHAVSNGVVTAEPLDLTPPATARLGCQVGAAGGLMKLIGAGFGPTATITASSDTSGRFPTELGGIRVIVSGQPAPLISVAPGVVIFQAPIVASIADAQLQTATGVVDFKVSPNNLPIALRLNSIDASGTGVAAALNQDGSANSESNPAAAGTIVQLFGTDGGDYEQTVPAGVVATSAIRLRGSVVAQIGLTKSVPAAVEYAGTAPGLITGANQINVRIPADFNEHGLIPIAVGVNRPCTGPCLYQIFGQPVSIWVR